MTISANSTALDDLRGEIDSIDESLLELLDRRMRACLAVAEIKRDQDIPMMAPDRLEAVRARCVEFAKAHDLNPGYLTDVFDVVTGESCRGEDQVIDGAGARPRGGRALSGNAVRIDHVAIAVRDLEDAIAQLRDRYGFELLERRQVSGAISGMDSATMQAGGVTFVLCQGDSPESNVSRYIEHYGPGVQHVALSVRDQPGLHTDLRERSADLLTGIIHAPGLDQSFTRRDHNTGIQLEFVTRTDNDGFHDNNVRELFTAMERENVY